MPYYSTKEVAKILGCTTENISYLVRKGKLRPVEGKGRFFAEAEVKKEAKRRGRYKEV